MLTKTAMKRWPTSPGEMLFEEFLKPAGITQIGLAEKMVPHDCVSKWSGMTNFEKSSSKLLPNAVV